jgi:hypothetical protein
MRLALRLHMPENLVRVRSSEFLQPGTAVVMDGMRPIHVAVPAPEPIRREPPISAALLYTEWKVQQRNRTWPSGQGA